MEMKIKGKLIIPLIAILIAMFTLGATPGTAVDTTVSDSLTYVTQTVPPTSSIEEEVEEIVSDMFGDDLKDAEEPIRGVSTIMEGLLSSLRNILNSFIRIFEGVGGIMGNSGGLFDDLLGGGSLF